MASTARWRITPIGEMNIIQAAKFEKIISAYRSRSGTKDSEMYLAQFEVTQEAPDAIALIEEQVTDAWTPGTDTADIHVESDSADDDVGGAGCEGVHIVYIDSNNAIIDVLQDMDGTSHSHLNFGEVQEFIGIYVDLTTTVVPVGTITLKNHAESEVYCTIVAGDTYSITSKMWIPDGYQGACVSLIPSFEIANGAAPLFDNGVNVCLDINGTLSKIRSIVPENVGKDICSPQPFDLPIDGEAYLGVAHETLDTDVNLTNTIDVTYLIWK